MKELELANRDRASGVNLLLGESSEAIEYADRIEGAKEEIGVEMDKMPSIIYVVPPKEDPKLAAKVMLEISSVEANTSFQH